VTALYEGPSGNSHLSNLDTRRDLVCVVPELALCVDIDDVIFPWYDRAHAACEAAGITNGVTPCTWVPHEEYGCTKEEWWQALGWATHSGDLYRGEPYPGAVQALWRLEAAGHHINLVTARGTHELIAPATRLSIHAQTRAWLHEHHIPYDTLTFSKDKTVVPADFSVDDNIGNYDALEAAGHYPYLVNRPWNIDDGDRRRRVDSLAEFASQIIGDPRARA
jgi:hypothetical protein